MGAHFKDMRGGTVAEQYIAYFVYIPFVTIFIISVLWKAIPNIKKAWAVFRAKDGEIP